MRTFFAVLLGIGIISGVFVIAVVIRPGYMIMREKFNSTIYDQNVTEATSQWTKARSTMDYLYWIIPIAVALIITGWVLMTAQQKEYVEAGYYR